MNVTPCAPYTGKLDRRTTLRMPDGISVFKTYFVSIPGRDEPARYEWGASAMPMAAAETLLLDSAVEGVGFITVFPHITKIFRFAPAVETVLHVRAFHTPELRPMSLDRDDGFTEFACLGEAVIAADEYRAWAETATVADYLDRWSEWREGAIINPAKLAGYVGNAETLKR